MSNEVFPALPGLMWDIDREEEWKNMSRESDSGRDFTRAIWTYPRRNYKLQYEFLRSGAEAELQSLVGFFNRHKGDFDTWLFDDPMDNVVVNEPLGATNGTQSTWQLTRAFGGSSSPVFELKAPPELYLNMGNWRGNERKYFTPRTNLFPWSENLGNWSAYTQNVTFGPGDTVMAPDGTMSADTITETTATGEHHTDRYQLYGTTGQFTFSAYLFSAASGRNGLLGMYSTGNNHAAWFNLTTGVATILTPLSGATAGMVDVGGGWWRCWITATITNTAGPIQRVLLTDPIGNNPYTGNGVGAIYTWGRQLNQGPLTPYIPTAGAAVTVTDATINSTGLVTLSPTPAAGGSLSWSGGYYWRCKFKQSRMAYKQFMQHLFSARSVDFKTYKP